VRSLALLPDGLRFVSGSSDETARIVEHGLAPPPN
jgi:WD40 repeat protein